MKPTLSLFLLAALACTAPTSARQGKKFASDRDRLPALEARVEELRAALRIPGLCGAVVRDREVIWTKGYGYADLENKVAATPDTNFRIASLTKTFASALLMQLVEQGKIDLDAPMAKLAPAFVARFGNEAVLVRHVLSHTSHDTPGENYRYDGNRFAYLTAAIERASGVGFRELLVRNVLDKIAMNGSVPGQDILDDPSKWSAFLDAAHISRYEQALTKLAKPYRLYGTELVPSLYPPRGISASAGLVSNVVDLAKYDAATDRYAFVTRETQERAWTPASGRNGRTLPYGLGWFIQQHQGERLIWHYGYWPDSFSSLYVKVPRANVSFILLANSDALSAPFRLGGGDVTRSAFANTFLQLFAFDEYQPNESHDFVAEWLDERRRSARTPSQVDPRIYDKYIGRYAVDSGESLTVSTEGHRLFVNMNASQKVEVFPETDRRFFGKAQDIQLTFDADGAAVEIQFRGRRIRAPKANQGPG